MRWELSLKELEMFEIGERAETFQTTALVRSAKILSRILKTWEDLLSLRLQRKIISLRRCEKLARGNLNINNGIFQSDLLSPPQPPLFWFSSDTSLYRISKRPCW